ncbi:unnamed protein product [Diatraea saccharalis]|uniref:Uncharacterized protein n=1 Tax=Diatraea saccharalis TaxID=40085 RepID=A0A9N9R6P6_9NEOP|nr:unnamed protein product [Diatraea saccharalis]
MRCCVPGCKSDSRYSSKSQGITFHMFPSEPSLRKTWFQVLGKKESWKPKERAAVCSAHFLCDDLYHTKSGLRKVRAGAVPFIVQDSSSKDSLEEQSLMVCRICLVMDTKLFSIRKYKLEKAYEQLTGVSVFSENRLPNELCVECAQRLINCNRFRQKSLRANSLMLELLKKHDELTKRNIQSISRENNQLASNLTTKTYVDSYDIYIDEVVENVQIAPEEVKPVDEPDLDTAVKIEENNDEEDDDEGNDDMLFNEYNEFDIKDDDYSTDDSLPLQETKKKSKQYIRSKKVKTDGGIKVDGRKKPFVDEHANNIFTITDLTLEEQLADIESRRESSNFKNGIFKCMECYKGFLDEEAYNAHMLRHTTACGEYACSICKIHFKHPHAARKHKTAHHTQRFSCNQCSYVTMHRQSARLHMKWHKGTKYKCPHCSEEFSKFTTYMGHVRIKHPSDFVCLLCGYSFVSEKGINLHKKLKHRLDNQPIPEDGPICEMCNLRFLDADALKRHLYVSARHKSVDGKRMNNTIKRRTPEIRQWERKKREFDKVEGPIPCEQCGIQLKDSRAYHGHFRRMHPDKNRTKYPSMKSPCMCEVCGRMFQSYALLKDHTWVHTGERPFKCDLCDKSFRMKQRLVTHKRIHSAEKTMYGCDLCGKQFSTHSNRQRHMFIHTGLKPFKCEMCGKAFKHSSEKRAHITYVHHKKPWPKRSRGKRRTDGRQLTMANQQLGPSVDIDIQPMWNCDPKMDLATNVNDKPYYTMKI